MKAIVKVFVFAAWFSSVSAFALFEGIRYLWSGIGQPWIYPVVALTIASFISIVLWLTYAWSTWRGI